MLWTIWLLAAAAPPDLAAVGVVTATRPEMSVAILRSAGRSRVVGVGEAAFGGRVRSIGSGRVVVDFDGQPVELRLSAAAPVRGALLRPPPAALAPAPGLSLERKELERRL